MPQAENDDYPQSLPTVDVFGNSAQLYGHSGGISLLRCAYSSIQEPPKSRMPFLLRSETNYVRFFHDTMGADFFWRTKTNLNKDS